MFAHLPLAIFVYTRRGVRVLFIQEALAGLFLKGLFLKGLLEEALQHFYDSVGAQLAGAFDGFDYRLEVGLADGRFIDRLDLGFMLEQHFFDSAGIPELLVVAFFRGQPARQGPFGLDALDGLYGLIIMEVCDIVLFEHRNRFFFGVEELTNFF